MSELTDTEVLNWIEENCTIEVKEWGSSWSTDDPVDLRSFVKNQAKTADEIEAEKLGSVRQFLSTACPDCVHGGTAMPCRIHQTLRQIMKPNASRTGEPPTKP